MKTVALFACLGCFFATAIGQVPGQNPQPPSYANYSIMLVNPGGGAVVLMHNPQNGLDFIQVNDTKRALSAGFVPVRAAELGEFIAFIAALKEENARLTAENVQLKGASAAAALPRSGVPSPEPSQADADRAARRRALIQSWLMLQNMNRPQTYNLNITDCTKTPALCAR